MADLLEQQPAPGGQTFEAAVPAAEQGAGLQEAGPQGAGQPESAASSDAAAADQLQRHEDEIRARQGVELHASRDVVGAPPQKLSEEAIRAQPPTFPRPGAEASPAAAPAPPWEQAPDPNRPAVGPQPAGAQETPLAPAAPGASPDQPQNERLPRSEPASPALDAPVVPSTMAQHAAETNQSPGFMRKVRQFFGRGGRHKL